MSIVTVQSLLTGWTNEIEPTVCVVLVGITCISKEHLLPSLACDAPFNVLAEKLYAHSFWVLFSICGVHVCVDVVCFFSLCLQLLRTVLEAG